MTDLATVVVRRATAADLAPMAALCNKVWAQRGLAWSTTLPYLQTLATHEDVRAHVLYQRDVMQAAIVLFPVRTDAGLAFQVHIIVVDQGNPDRVMLLDAICLYALNLGVSLGCRRVIARHDKRDTGNVYGRDFVDMDATDEPDNVYELGDPQVMIAAILRRHPEWATSL